MNQTMNDRLNAESPENDQADRSPEKFGATLKKFVKSLTQGRHWWTVAIILVLVRMFLVAHDEIVPVDNDARNYAFQVQSYMTEYGRFPAQPPGIAILAIAAGNLGIPYKLALDWIFMATCILVANQFRFFTSSGFGSLIVLGVLILNSWFTENAVFFMSEPVVAIQLLLLLESARWFLCYPVSHWSWRTGIMGCLVSSAIVVARPEQPMVLCFWGLVALISLVLRWKNWKGVPVRNLSWRWTLLVLPFVGTIGGQEIVKKIHRDQYGVASLAIIESKGLTELLNALYTIDPDEKIRYAPVTYQSLTAACDECPTLNEVRSGLLNKSNFYYAICKTTLKLDGQFGTWLNWLLVSNFGGLNSKTNQLMLLAAQEVREAQREGRLKHRPGMYPVEPLTEVWLKEVPGKFCEAYYHAIWPHYYSNWIDTLSNTEQVIELVDTGNFDDGLMRRLGTNPEAKLRFHGALDNGNESVFVAVRLETATGDFVAAEMIKVISSGRSEFKIETPAHEIRDVNADFVLVFIGPDNSKSAPVKLKNIHAFGTAFFPVQRPAPNGESGSSVEQWRVSTWAPPRGFYNRETIKNLLETWSMTILLILSVVMFLTGIMTHLSPEQFGGALRFLIAGVGLNSGRLLFFALIEVWTLWGLPRYAASNNLLTILIILTASFLLGTMIRRIIESFRESKTGKTIGSVPAQT